MARMLGRTFEIVCKAIGLLVTLALLGGFLVATVEAVLR